MNTELEKYILSCREKGIENEQIRQTLITAGWQSKLVDSALGEKTSGAKIQIPKKVILVIIPVLVLVALSIVIFLVFRNHKDDSQQSTSTASTSFIPASSMPSIQNHLIAYTTTDSNSRLSAIYIYDLDTSQSVPAIPELTGQQDLLIQTGSWSPDGKLLPVVAIISPGSDSSRVQIYKYDASSRASTKIYDSPRNEENSIWSVSGITFTSFWIDNSNFALTKNMSNVTYIGMDGVIQKKEMPGAIRRINNQLEYTETSTLINNSPLSFKPEGSVIGIIDGILYSLKEPNVTSFIVDDAGNAADPQGLAELNTKAEELKNQGLTDEELSLKLLEFIEPKGEILLAGYQLPDGASKGDINLTDSGWQVQSIILHPSGNFFIAHQTDKFFQATNERFIKITPGQNPSTQILFGRKLTESFGSPNYMSLLMYQGSSFSLSQDGQWIIGMSGTKVIDPASSKVFINNISSGEERLVCDAYCWDYKSFNPTDFRNSY